VGWLWYLGTLVPVIGLVQVGEQSLADRYTYIPLIGIFVMAAWLGADLVQRRPGLRGPLAAIGALALLACGVVTRQQTIHWRDDLSLWDHAVRVTANNPIAHNSIADPLIKLGRIDEATEHLREALRLEPDYVNAWINLGMAHDLQGRPDDAAE